MDKADLIERLLANHTLFMADIDSLDPEKFQFSKDNSKWTAGQQADHILRSTRPVALILLMPPNIIKLIFGKANRESKSYEALVAKYKLKLSSGGRARGRFLPKEIQYSRKNILLKKLRNTVQRISKELKGWSEAELDTVILPHPLLGKLTIREMMYFTIYHVEHHRLQIQKNLSSLEE